MNIGQVVAGDTTPNIIFIVADDMGFGDSLAYNPASKVPMPNLTRLANEGVRFTRAYTSVPKCAPSRYNYLSGNYHWRGRVNWGVWNFFGGSQVLPGQETIANVLQPAYDTTVVGKYHLGGHFYKQGSDVFMQGHEDPALVDFTRPMEDGAGMLGFDYSYVLLRGIQDTPYSYFENDALITPPEQLVTWQQGWHNSFRSRILRTGPGDPDYDSSLTGFRFVSAAMARLQQVISQPNPEPFFLYYPAIPTHHPNTPPDYFYGVPVRDTQFHRRADTLVELDLSLGILLDFLDQNNLAQNTLIIFTSDNGGQEDGRQANIDNYDHDLNGGLLGGKGEIWEGGVRVPLVMRWGDGTSGGSTIPPGTVSEQLIALQDIPATISAVVGEPVAHGQMNDSYNLIEELTAPGSSGRIRGSLLLEAREMDKVNVPPHFAIVEQDWKLVLDSADQPFALFDMRTDPNETTNLLPGGLHSEVVERLREKLLFLRAGQRTAPLHDAVPLDASPSGKPTLAAEDAGIFVWSLDSTGGFELAAKSAQNTTKVSRIELVADTPFESVEAKSLEAHVDNLDWDGDRTIVFTGYSTGGSDGFTARLPRGATAVARVLDTSDLKSISYGAEKDQRGPLLILNNRRGVTPALEPGMSHLLINGRPSFATPDAGVFLWSEANDGSFEVAVKSAMGTSMATQVEIIADNDFTDSEGVGLEAVDTLNITDGNRLFFTASGTDDTDGFRAMLPTGSTFLVMVSGPGVDGSVAYGPNKALATPNAWYLPISELTHDGTSESARRLANLSVAPSTTISGQVELRWRGDGSGTPFLVDLLFDQALSSASAAVGGPVFQDFSTTTKSLSASTFLLDETGGVDVQVPTAEKVGIFLHDANGQIPDYLVNLPDGLGAPNAHRVKLAEPVPPGC